MHDLQVPDDKNNLKSANFLVHRNPSLHGDYKKSTELKSVYLFGF